ncbi:MAG TPA: sigma 54-interacting transcriptional regulator [Candidatus Binatia bacterium]|nr:sigma 54-interacting transcriptional regulator [Candidatus Binatia bacterium]
MKALSDLLGDSPGIRAVRDRVARLLERPGDSRRLPPILIQGETGTGKGLLARMIHRAGPRPDGPFVDVNCPAIPETLLEAEMFGFERGAFTDARRSKPGLFQAAHRGTIFLDEVGLLPEALQAKLLKVLEDRTVRRLGATRDEAVDVWIVTATNEDLRLAVRERRFREDLYHRLAVLTVALPPLRERGDDIVTLAEHFLARVCVDYGVAPKTFGDDARAVLRAYRWPGNVRELSNVVERVVLQSGDDVITAAQLGLAEAAFAAEPARPEAVSLDDAMREHLVEVLTQTGWNISRTATLLGISRNTLRARMDRYGLRERENAPKPAARPRPAAGAAAPARPARPVAAPPPAPAPAPASGRRWVRRRVALLRAALVPPSGPDAGLETARALEVMVEKARTFGGALEGIGPIGIVAAFGVDAAGDAADRAAHAAMAMVKAIERARREEGAELGLKIGVHATGAVVGVTASDAALDMDERRDLWPLLDELVEQAPLDGILVSAAAAPLLTRRFELAPGPSLAGGGAQILVGRERTGLGLGARLVHFVGRRHELSLLDGRLASAMRGQGQIVSIGGEAGIGKSRLLYEFRQGLAGRETEYLEAHCLSFGSGVPYLPVLDLVRGACRLIDTDTPEATAEKVRRALDDAGLDARELAPYLLHLLGVKEGGDDVLVQSHEALKTRIFEILREMLRQRSRRRPLVLVVEDLHWMDATSAEFYESLTDAVAGAPILLIATYRPGFRPPWIDKAYATHVTLQPLDPDEARRVVQAVLRDSDVPAALVEVILAKAEGNAFFLEELARSVRAPREAGAPIVVPDTVQDVLLARIDRLPPEARRLLTSAAVIGKDFASPVLQAITGLSAETVGRGLAELEAAEFVHETVGGGEPEYTFKHALTHEVAYGSVDEPERRRLHAGILAELEPHHRGRLENLQRLADHAVRGAVWDKALAYLRQAGGKAYTDGAHREAVRAYEQALAALAKLPASRERRETAIDLRFDLRTSLLPLGEVERGLAYVREAEDLALELGDERRAAQIAIYLTGQLYLMGEHDRAWEAGERALALGGAGDDFGLRVSTNTYLGQVRLARGDYREAATFFRDNAGVLVGERARERFGLPQLPSVHSRMCLAWSLAEQGEFGEALARADEAVAIAEAVDQPLSRTVAYVGLGVARLRRGEHARAITILEQALGLIRDWSIPLWFPRVASTLGVAYALGGRAAEGVPLIERAVERATTMRLVGGLALLIVYQAEACLLAGRLDDAAAFAERALALARAHRERGYEAMALRITGEIALARGEAAGAETALGEARALADSLGMQPLVAHCDLGHGVAARRQGREDEGRGRLTAARARYAQLGMTAGVTRADAELGAAR